MNVTKNNFLSVRAIIEQKIAESAFISIDLEMTGISSPQIKMSVLDTPAERYEKFRQIVEQSSMLQIGMCCFRQAQTEGLAKNSDTFAYVAAPFNFYTFPRSISLPAYTSDPFVGLRTSAMEFNRRHGMDFSEWISNGINFVDEAAEKAIQSAFYEKKNSLSETFETKLLGEGFETYSADKLLDKLGSSETAKVTRSQIASIDQWYAYGTEDEAFEGCGNERHTWETTEACSPLVSFILQKYIRQTYPDLTVEARQRRYDQVVVAHKWSQQEKVAFEKEYSEKEAGELLEYLGFRHVWKLLVNSRKPVIFHNGFLDILFLIHNLEKALPRNYLEFKRLKEALLPETYDTKYLSGVCGIPNKFTQLEKLVAYLEIKKDELVSFTEATDFDRYARMDAPYHEAGYDALMCGSVYGFLLHKQQQKAAFSMEQQKNYMPIYGSLYTCNFNFQGGGILSEDLFAFPNASAQSYIINNFPGTFSTNDIEFILMGTNGTLESDIEAALSKRLKWLSDTSIYIQDLTEGEYANIVSFIDKRKANDANDPMEVLCVSKVEAKLKSVQLRVAESQQS